MKYMGSKNRIAKYLIPIVTKDLKEGQYYVEPFCGGCNMIDKVKHPLRIGADYNEYLIAMWKALQDGWIPPDFIERDEHKIIVNNIENYEKSYIGYCKTICTYSGTGSGYAGKVLTKTGILRDYQDEGRRSLIKQKDMILGIDFYHSSYDELNIPNNSIIYCDPPYRDTSGYKNVTPFNHEDFYSWVRDKVNEGHQVYISEYNMPDDFVCIWEKDLKSSLSANGKQGGSKKSTEKLFVHKSQYGESSPNEIDLNEF